MGRGLVALYALLALSLLFLFFLVPVPLTPSCTWLRGDCLRTHLFRTAGVLLFKRPSVGEAVKRGEGESFVHSQRVPGNSAYGFVADD